MTTQEVLYLVQEIDDIDNTFDIIRTLQSIRAFVKERKSLKNNIVCRILSLIEPYADIIVDNDDSGYIESGTTSVTITGYYSDIRNEMAELLPGQNIQITDDTMYFELPMSSSEILLLVERSRDYISSNIVKFN